jgi:hypothetical protein
VFNTRSPSSRHAGEQAFQRMYARTQDRDQPATRTTRQAQYDTVCAWGIPDHTLLQRLPAISQPVFVANGDSDPMILPHYSYLLAGLIPQAQVKIYRTRRTVSVPASHRVRRRCRGIPQRSGPGRQRANQLTFSIMQNRAAPLIIQAKAAAASASPESTERPVRAARTAGMTIEVAAHIGGSRATAAASDRHAARLAFQSVSEPSE